MPRGGKRTGAGRPAGAPNKVNADLREAAQQYTSEALATLRTICNSGASEAARVAAASAILDRGHGKPAATAQVDVVAEVTQQNASYSRETVSETAAWIESVLAKTKEHA
jgi:hypothetical protein